MTALQLAFIEPIQALAGEGATLRGSNWSAGR